MSGWIFVDKDSDSQMRQNMRSRMRGGNYRSYGASSTSMRDEEYRRGYETGYRHGVEDWEDDDMEYRRRRDSRGRYA